MSTTTSSSGGAFATRSERDLALSILRDDFGETAERIALQLLRSEGLRLPEIIQRVQAAAAAIKPSVHDIKSNLLKLLQHNVLDVKPVAMALGGRKRTAINLREVLYRLRFPKFIEQAREGFGEEGEVIMEELLVQGRVRMDQSIDAMAYTLAEHQRLTDESKADEEISEEELEENRAKIRAVFVEMAKQRYISRVHPLDMKIEPEPEQPDFPASIMRGNDGSTTPKTKTASAGRNSTHGNGSGSANTTNGAAGAAAKTTDTAEDGITVRGKRKKQATASGSNIPVELQMMLEADDLARKEEDEEAEFEGMEPRGGAATKKRKLSKNSKRAKLPSRGATTTTENEDPDSPGGMGEQSLVWRFGVDQLLRDLRHRACVKFAKENINNVAGVIVGAMLTHSSPHEREKDEATSFPVSARDLFAMPAVKNALPKDSKDTWRLLLNYITVMCRDKSGMVMKVAAEAFDATQARAGDGGQYVVHMKKIMDFLKQSSAHAYVQERFGTPSARRLVKMQEIPKRADHNPAFTIFCWSVDVPQLERAITERIQDSLGKLRRRRKFEAEENKDLIARSDQLVEPNDLAKFDKLSRALDRLDRATIQLDEMLMLYHKNKDSPAEAQHRFQDISEAYDVLSDPQKRAIFDQYGYDGLKNGVPDESGDMRDGYAFNDRAADEVFARFFGTSNPFYDFGFADTMPFASSLRKKGPEKAEAIVVDVDCSLEELFLGVTKTLLVERKRLQNDELIDDPKTFQIKVKPGWKHGTKVTFEREGSESRTHEAGDVVFRIVQLPHSLYVRDGANLTYTAKLKLAEALSDYCVEVPTLDGRKLAISCNEVINPQSEKVVKGEGMPISSKPGTRGDLLIKFNIIFPKHLTSLQKSALVKILG
ncbi:TPA: hypothetical protein N0F65_006367 [Lagenidium giganteum]|uniref:J domain-containing protein n=1 Tax=Lagenidium giganteum TaxID=4803 RepID=A0AAV2YSF4_9STRA|nr:TPA: hypothetical protein N0F65_006367 [Lagenidium giganteum]